ADQLDDRDPRQRLRALVPVERERERAPHALVIPRPLLVVAGDEEDAVPRALLHDDLVPERAHDAVTLRRRNAAELDVRALRAQPAHLRRRVPDVEPSVTVEIRLALVPIARILLREPVRAAHVLH